jgi:hypothetical protein
MHYILNTRLLEQHTKFNLPFENSIKERNQNICVVSMHEYDHGLMSQLNEHLRQHKFVFAQTHMMGFSNLNIWKYRQLYPHLASKWLKFHGLLDIITSDKNHNYEWYMWIDADVIFTNNSCSFQRLLSANHHAIFNGDFNSGVFFIRNHVWSVEFLKTWFAMHTTRDSCDNALGQLILNDTWNPHIYAMNLSIFGLFASYPTIKKQILSWYPGHCILHAAGFLFEKASILHSCLYSEYSCVKKLRKLSMDQNNTAYLQLTNHLKKKGYN